MSHPGSSIPETFAATIKQAWVKGNRLTVSWGIDDGGDDDEGEDEDEGEGEDEDEGEDDRRLLQGKSWTLNIRSLFSVEQNDKGLDLVHRTLQN